MMKRAKLRFAPPPPAPQVAVITLSAEQVRAIAKQAAHEGAMAVIQKTEARLEALHAHVVEAAGAAPDRWLTTDKAADLAGLRGKRRAETVAGWITGGRGQQGPLPARKVGRAWRIRRSDLDAWLADTR